MPRTAQCVAGDQTVGERRMVMRAVRSHREEFITAAGQNHIVVIDMPDNHRVIGKSLQRNAAFQIRF